MAVNWPSTPRGARYHQGGEGMPFGYETTHLWETSLGIIGEDPYSAPRGKLRSAYSLFRERAAMLAAEIPLDLREFTAHDITHSDALWELADCISGKEITLTPTEAFVLGGAFLIHDLGMALASFQGGMADLMQQPGWNDILAACISEELGRPVEAEDLESPSVDALAQAKCIALRENHANHAEGLALMGWSVPGGPTYHLIENEDLRENYGSLIGRIAASHGWNIDRIASEFPRNEKDAIGAPVDCPDEWTVDPLKLACLLRLADAAHLDARRAPGFLNTIRQPSGAANQHWTFQGHIQRPRLEEDYLLYTASRPFKLKEAAAWWLCYETLQMVDRELHGVDVLMLDCMRKRMGARRVKGADSPFRLSDHIPADGWTPVNAKVEVTNVPALIKKLGGASLYGESHDVALRELIQNASDATLARETLTGEPPGTIEVRLLKKDQDWYVEVIDNGVGMSQQVMTGPLLDFGSSYWGSQLMRAELPGLMASSFRSAGRFGIGFYSAFMLGDDVKVTSRRFDEGISATRVLEFSGGLYTRPIIRRASREETRYSVATVVSIKLNSDPYEPGGLLDSLEGRRALADLCTHLAPGLPCDLTAVESDGPRITCVQANDWKTIEPEELVRRLAMPGISIMRTGATIADTAEKLVTIERDGVTIARAGLAPVSSRFLMPDGAILLSKGIVASGGLLISEIGDVVGIFEGSPETAARSKGRVSASPEEMFRWASKQAELWKEDLNGYPLDSRIDLLATLGADLAGIDICFCSEGQLNSADLKLWARQRNRIVAVNADWVDTHVYGEDKGDIVFWSRSDHLELEISEDILITPWHTSLTGWDGLTDFFPDKRWKPLRANEYNESNNSRNWWYFQQRRAHGIIVKSIADGWGLDLEGLLDRLTVFYREDEPVGMKIVGTDDFLPIPCEWVARRDLKSDGAPR